MISVVADDTIWMHSESKGKWFIWQKSQALDDATKSRKGVVQVGDGINVTSGVISTDKNVIGLGNVDNIKQYSANNPAPEIVTFDGTKYTGTTKTGVYITSNAVKFVKQSLTASEKEQARANIGAADTTQADWSETSKTAQGYIKNKPSIPTKTSDLINDDYTVKDADYTSKTFSSASQKNTTISQVSTNASDIKQLKKDVKTNADDIDTEETRATAMENTLQQQINLLKGKTQILGGTDCPIGKEQSVLTAYAQNVTGDTANRPQEGDLINVMTDGSGNSRNEQWQWIVIRDTKDNIVSSSWVMVSGPPIVNIATETSLGVSMFPTDGGLKVNANGEVTTNKKLIGLGNVDDVQQYSVDNPVPLKITVDKVAFSGNSANGVNITTGAVLYDRNQALTDAQKKTVKSNLGIEATVKPDWEAEEFEEAGILNKPTIPDKTSQLTNDSHFVVDTDYVHTDYNYDQASKDNLATNTTAIENLTPRVTQAESDIETERINRTNADKDLQIQIDNLKGVPTFVGSIATMSDTSDLTKFVTETKNLELTKGQQVSVLDENVVYQYNGKEWVVYLSSNISDATTESKGVVQIGTGITVSNGVISADKTSIGLQYVDNIRQYSVNNPVPINITLDGALKSGTSESGVDITTDYLRFSTAQNLSDAQRLIARTNLGITDNMLATPDWDASYGNKGYIANKPIVPEKLSQLENDNDTVIDANYETRVFVNETEKTETLNQIETNKEDIDDIINVKIKKIKEDIEDIQKKTFFIGSIADFSKEEPTATEVNEDLNSFVLQKVGTTPLDGYQVSVLSTTTTYQYSATTKAWEVLATNQAIEFASKKVAGLVQVGDGIEVDENGVISIDSEEVDSTKDYAENNVTSPKYIHNRTHFSVGSNEVMKFDESFWDYDKLTASGAFKWLSDKTTIHDKLGFFKISDYPYDVAELRLPNTNNMVFAEYNKETKLYEPTTWNFVDGYSTTKDSSTYFGITTLRPLDKNDIDFRLISVHEDGTDVLSNWGGFSYVLDKGTYLQTGVYTETDGDGAEISNTFKYIVNSLTIANDVAKKLDEKYIPDTFATKEWVMEQSTAEGSQSDWNNGNVLSQNFIKNKPFGTLPIINGDYDGSTTDEPYLLLDNSQKFYWTSNEVAPIEIVSANLDTIKFKLSNDSDTILEGASDYSTVSDNVHRYSMAVGSIRYHFAVVDSDQYDADGNLELSRGLYVSAPRSSGVYIKRIYSTVTYEKENENIWKGTLAEYEAARDTIKDGTTIFITDDMTDGRQHSINGVDTWNVSGYLPVSSGESGQILVSNGDKKTPTWRNSANKYTPGTEFDTGEIWVDGNKIYRKTVAFAVPTCPSNGSNASSTIDVLSNVENVVKIEGMVVSSGSTTYASLPMFYGNTYYCVKLYTSRNTTTKSTNVRVENTYTGFNGCVGYVTTYYTKAN